MCGFAGIISYKKDQNIASRVNEMILQMRHRGPDDKGVEVYHTENCNVSLGHVRLSIMDISNDGHQPMSYNGYTIVFNGEIYNFKTIRNKLIKKGYTFQSHCDTEVVLKSYIEYVESCVLIFNGIFAFAIWDVKRKLFMLPVTLWG